MRSEGRYALLAGIAAIAIAVGMVAARPAQGAEAGATLRVLPTSTTPGQPVTALGEGFCGTCGPVEIAITGQVVATTDVQGDGSFSVQFAAPSMADMYQVVATQRRASALGVTSSLLVLIADTPPSGSPPAPPATVDTDAPPGGPPTTQDTVPDTTTTTRVLDEAGRHSERDDRDTDGAGWAVALAIAAVVLGGTTIAVVVRRRRSRR